jgi:hypothetical protein
MVIEKCTNSGHEKCTTLRHSLGKKSIIFPFRKIGGKLAGRRGNDTEGGVHGHMGVAQAGAFGT